MKATAALLAALGVLVLSACAVSPAPADSPTSSPAQSPRVSLVFESAESCTQDGVACVFGIVSLRGDCPSGVYVTVNLVDPEGLILATDSQVLAGIRDGDSGRMEFTFPGHLYIEGSTAEIVESGCA